MSWDRWKQGFGVWEQATAQYLENHDLARLGFLTP